MSPYRREQRGASTQTETINIQGVPPLLRLRAPDAQQDQEQPRREADSGSSSRPSVRWESDVVDNENMNKKKTKICCIFHPRDDGEEFNCPSDHEEKPSSSSSSSSSSEADEQMGLNFEERRARRVVRRHRKLSEKRSESPNAYEIQPDYTNHHVQRD